MKQIKYVTGFLLFLLAFTFVGEIYVWNLDSFESEYKYVTFYIQEDTTESEMMKDIQKEAEKEKVEVFIVNCEVTSLFSEKLDIYATSKSAFESLAKKSDIREGKFKSIFLGNVYVLFHPWEEIPEIGKIENYYVIGKEECITKFKQNLVDKYAGAFPKEGYQEINSRRSIGVVWICVTLFLLLLTFYEIAQKKKNVVLRITIGEQILYYVLKQILWDILVYSGMFLFILGILSIYTNAFYLKQISIIIFLTFLAVNSLAYFSMLFTDYKKDIQTKVSAKNILKISYVFKMVTSIFVVILMTGCMELIFQGIDCYRQRDFFETKKDYFYVVVGGADFEEDKNLMQAYYRNGLQSGKTVSLVDLGNWGTEVEYIFADKGAYDYLSTIIPEIQGKSWEDRMYCLVPKGYQRKAGFLEDLEDIGFSYLEMEEYEIVEYERNRWVMAISDTGQVNSSLKKNPVVIFNPSITKEVPIQNILYISYGTLFSFSDEEFENIALENDFHEQHYKTNAYETYLYTWETTKRSMIMGILFFIILMLLEGLVLKNILKYEYQINAKELLLSKIHGDSFVFRQRKAITILIGGCLSLAISVLLCIAMSFSSTFYVMAGGIFILVMEHLFVAEYSHKLDHVNISKVFKGGIL